MTSSSSPGAGSMTMSGSSTASLPSSPSTAQRPRSAREVLAAFPSEDPLEAAVAAGETPSPRSVAAAPRLGTLAPLPAWGLLGFVAVALLACHALAARVNLADLGPRLAMDVLQDRAGTTA